MRQILDNLGFSTKYKGYTMLLEAIEMATEDEEKASNCLLYTSQARPDPAGCRSPWPQ